MKFVERTRDSPVYELSFDGSHDKLSEIRIFQKLADPYGWKSVVATFA